jgi:hypothetical protein
MNRVPAIAASLGVLATGFVVGSAAIAGSPWPIPGNLLGAILVGGTLGLLETLAIRRFAGSRFRQLYLLDGAPFPFTSVGVAAAIIVFGVR